MAVVVQDGRPGLGTLLRELAEGSATLVRSEVRLARVEVAEALGAMGRGAVLTGMSAVLALLGGLSLLAGLILLVGDQWLPRDMYWLAAFIVVVITGGLAAWFAKRGLAQLSPKNLAPDETVRSLRETKNELLSAVKR